MKHLSISILNARITCIWLKVLIFQEKLTLEKKKPETYMPEKKKKHKYIF